jgi:multimeric flavodoxin WrbA
MNIVCLLGSPRQNGNSATIAGRLMESAAALGATTRTFRLNQLTYRGCQGCYACKKELDHCIVKDGLTEVLEAVSEADVVVMASPVYYGDITGQLKCFIDRSFSFLKPDYLTTREPSRLSPGKLVFVLTQGHPDEALFADIFPKYSGFLSWTGFKDGRLLRACGIGPSTRDSVPVELLSQADAVARELMGK